MLDNYSYHIDILSTLHINHISIYLILFLLCQLLIKGQKLQRVQHSDHVSFLPASLKAIRLELHLYHPLSVQTFYLMNLLDNIVKDVSLTIVLLKGHVQIVVIDLCELHHWFFSIL